MRQREPLFREKKKGRRKGNNNQGCSIHLFVIANVSAEFNQHAGWMGRSIDPAAQKMTGWTGSA